MNPIEALTKTQPRSIEFDSVPGTTFRDKFEAFAELHRLKDDAYCFLTAKYLGDRKSFIRSIAHLQKRHGNDLVMRRACIIALGQHVEPNKFGGHCYQCHGSGDSELGVTCKVCEGSGKKAWPVEWYAHQLEVSVKECVDFWLDKIGDLYIEAGYWEDDTWREWLRRCST